MENKVENGFSNYPFLYKRNRELCVTPPHAVRTISRNRAERMHDNNMTRCLPRFVRLKTMPHPPRKGGILGGWESSLDNHPIALVK